MADKTPEMIEQEMHDTRQSLAGKLSALETSARETLASVKHDVQEVTGSVSGAVGGVRALLGGGGGDSVSGPEAGAADISGTIKHGISQVASAASGEIRDAMDVSPQVREKPWQYVGGAVAAGFVVGLVFGPGRSSSGGVHAAYGAPRAPGIFDDLVQMLGSEVRKIGEQAISQLTQSVNQSVKSNVPKLVDTAVSRVVDAAGGGATASTPHAAPAGNSATSYGRR